jgi:hypothetical protein
MTCCILLWAIGFALVMGRDIRVTYIVGWLPSVLWVVYIDGSPGPVRSRSRILAPAMAILVSICLQVGLMTGAFGVTSTVFQLGEITISSAGIISSAMMTCIVYAARMLYSGWKYKDCLTILRSPVVSYKLAKVHQDLLRAGDRISADGGMDLKNAAASTSTRDAATSNPTAITSNTVTTIETVATLLTYVKAREIHLLNHSHSKFGLLPSNMTLINHFVENSFRGVYDNDISRASHRFFTADGNGRFSEFESESDEGDADGDVMLEKSKDRIFLDTVQPADDNLVRGNTASARDAATGSPSPMEVNASKGGPPRAASKPSSKPIGRKTTRGKMIQSIVSMLDDATVARAGEEVRLARPIMEVEIINTQHTLATLLLGERVGLAISGLLKNYFAGLVLYILALLGVAVGLVALVGLVPSYWCLVGAIAIQPNIILNCILPLNVSLSRRLIHTFDFKYLFGNITLWTIAFCVAFDWDLRSCYIIGWYPGSEVENPITFFFLYGDCARHNILLLLLLLINTRVLY